MQFLTTNIGGDSNVGLYGFGTDKYGVIGLQSKARKALQVPVHRAVLFGTALAGIFAAGNSSGIVVSALAVDDEERAALRSVTGVLALKTRYTALGNLIVMNDNGAVVSPLLRSELKEIASFFGVTVAVSAVAGLVVTGSAALATNRGCIVHPRIRAREKKVLEETLGVPVAAGTVSFGSPLVRSGLIANSHGAVISEACSGIELGAISEALGFS